MLQCEFCKRTFKTGDAYRRHLNEKHPEKMDGREGRRQVYELADRTYDVDGILAMIARSDGRYGPHNTVITENLIEHISLYEDPDQEYIDNLTPERLAKPCLIVRDEIGQGHLIDGHHRLRRLHKDGARTFPAYVVPFADAVPYIIRKA